MFGIGGKMATQKVYASYQEIIDLHTESDRVSAIGIHTPTGSTPHKMFSGFYDQFKKYKYLGCSVTLVPAARLPVDPLGVSYEAGEPTIDPRDLLNPILWHGCHGQDIGAILNQLYSAGVVGSSNFADVMSTDSIDKFDFINTSGDIPFETLTILEKLYYKALTDNTWKKAHPQKGFKKSGLRPLIYSMATTHQIMPMQGGFDADPEDIQDLGVPGSMSASVDGSDIVFTRGRSYNQQFIANRLRGLGWMDTRNVLTNVDAVGSITPASMSEIDPNQGIAAMLDGASKRSVLPTLYMGVILLPPAYKTEQYFRMIINHRFAFAGFRGISFQNDAINEDAPSVFNLNDPNYEYDPDDETGGLPSLTGIRYALLDVYRTERTTITSSVNASYPYVYSKLQVILQYSDGSLSSVYLTVRFSGVTSNGNFFRRVTPDGAIGITTNSTSTGNNIITGYEDGHYISSTGSSLTATYTWESQSDMDSISDAEKELVISDLQNQTVVTWE